MVDNALRPATVGHARFDASLRELEALGPDRGMGRPPAALGAITGAAGGAEGEAESRRAKAAADADKAAKDRTTTT